jgi:hypothetical protein
MHDCMLAKDMSVREMWSHVSSTSALVSKPFRRSIMSPCPSWSNGSVPVNMKYSSTPCKSRQIQPIVRELAPDCPQATCEPGSATS